MKAKGKKYQDVAGKVDRTRKYPLEEGIRVVKETATAKFDETVELSVRLGVDPRRADQNIRGAVGLPHGLGKPVRVLALARGEKEKEAEEAGADFVGNDELIKRITEGWLDFDKVVATPDMMGAVGRIGKILGPRGLMPNPRSGTVAAEIGKAVREIKAGRLEYRVDKAGIVHLPIGKVSFDPGALLDNAMAVVGALVRARPAAAKGAYIKSVAIAATMGPGVRIDPAEVRVMAV